VAGQDFSGRAFQQTDLKRGFATDGEHVDAARCPDGDKLFIATLDDHDHPETCVRQIGEHLRIPAGSIRHADLPGFVSTGNKYARAARRG
jgi:hypothetical protein